MNELKYPSVLPQIAKSVAYNIEWAYNAGTFYITQSRPITTLKNTTI